MLTHRIIIFQRDKITLGWIIYHYQENDLDLLHKIIQQIL